MHRHLVRNSPVQRIVPPFLGENSGHRRWNPAKDSNGHVDGDRARHKRQPAAIPEGLQTSVAGTLAAEEGSGDLGDGRRRSIKEQRSAVHFQNGPEGGRRDSCQFQS